MEIKIVDHMSGKIVGSAHPHVLRVTRIIKMTLWTLGQ